MKVLLLLIVFALALTLTSCEDVSVDESLVMDGEINERSVDDTVAEADGNAENVEKRENKDGADDVDTEEFEQRGSEGEEDGEEEEEEVDEERGLSDSETIEKRGRWYYRYCSNCKMRPLRIRKVLYRRRWCRVIGRYYSCPCKRPRTRCRSYGCLYYNRPGRCYTRVRSRIRIMIRCRINGRWRRIRYRLRRRWCYCRIWVR